MAVGNRDAIASACSHRHPSGVKVLKLCTSDEFAEGIPDEARAYRVAERVIHERTGEDVETVLQTIWPTEKLPELVERWAALHQPDVVLFVVSPFWTTFESVPLALQRRFGRVGELLGTKLTQVGDHPRITASFPVRVARAASLRLLSGAYYFEPLEVVGVVEASARKLLANESLEIVVRGPLVALGHHGSRKSLARAEKRREQTDRVLAALCSRIHLAYVGRPETATAAGDRARFGGDMVHTDVMAHRERGELEGAAIADVWLRTHVTADGG